MDWKVAMVCPKEQICQVTKLVVASLSSLSTVVRVVTNLGKMVY